MIFRKLSPALQEIAVNELNEDPCKIQEDIKYICDWINKQPHLYARTDDQFLLAFLRGCKFSLLRTQEKLDYYYTVKTVVTELFSNRDPYNPDVQQILQLGLILPLPNVEASGSPRIILTRFNIPNLDRNMIIPYYKVLFMILDIMLLEDDNLNVSGGVFWTDGKHAPIRQTLIHLTPALIKKLNEITTKAYPIRIKAIHCTDVHPMVETLYKVAKSFHSKKINERMFLYSDKHREEFYKKIPVQLQPEEYGGKNSSIKELTKSWKKKVEGYSNWFLEDIEYGTKEELRLGEPKTSATMFGLEGTFRTLTVD